jgi:hypothetical protein
MAKTILLFSLLLGLSGCVGGDKTPAASPKQQHLASDMERQLDRAKALQRQMEEGAQAPERLIDKPAP